MAEVNPALPQLVRHNREFICAAVARAAAAGIGQFLDLGSGLPAHPAVHEAAREVIPDARVCYVDIDPVAVPHGEVLLARGEGLAAVRADLTHPETVSSGHYEDEELASRVQQTGTYARFWNHDAANLASMLGELELVAPGVCEARNWVAQLGGDEGVHEAA